MSDEMSHIQLEANVARIREWHDRNRPYFGPDMEEGTFSQAWRDIGVLLEQIERLQAALRDAVAAVTQIGKEQSDAG